LVANLDRLGQLHLGLRFVRLALLGDDVQADVDALVADVDRGAGDQLLHVPLVFIAETASQRFAVTTLAGHDRSPGKKF
jgi:hypothetical protein